MEGRCFQHRCLPMGRQQVKLDNTPWYDCPPNDLIRVSSAKLKDLLSRKVVAPKPIFSRLDTEMKKKLCFCSSVSTMIYPLFFFIARFRATTASYNARIYVFSASRRAHRRRSILHQIVDLRLVDLPRTVSSVSCMSCIKYNVFVKTAFWNFGRLT